MAITEEWQPTSKRFRQSALILCFLLQAACIGGNSVTTVLIEPLRISLAVSSAEILLWTVGVQTLFMSAASPFAGVLISHCPIAAVMAGCVAAIGAGWVWLGSATQIWQVGLAYGLCFGVGLITLSLSSSTLIASLYRGSTGSATSVMMLGYTLGAALLPIVFAYGLNAYSMQHILNWYGWILVLLIPLVMLFSARLSAISVGAPDATSSSAGGESGSDVTEGRDENIASILRSRPFAACAITQVVCGIAGGVAANILVLYALELGTSGRSASLLVSIFFAASAAGTVLFGRLSDKVSVSIAIASVVSVLGLSSAVFLAADGYPTLIFGALMLGIGVGSSLVLPAILVTTFFGARYFVRVLSWLTPCSLLAISAALPLAGWVNDAHESYRAIFAATLTIALAGGIAATVISLSSGRAIYLPRDVAAEER
jgi:MFS family permease